MYLKGEHVEMPPKQHIIDACSLLRHKIILSMYFIGGPNERVHPTPTDPMGSLFSTLPPPHSFVLTESSQGGLSDVQMSRWLQEYCVAARDGDVSAISSFRQMILQELWGVSFVSNELVESQQHYSHINLVQSDVPPSSEIEV